MGKIPTQGPKGGGEPGQWSNRQNYWRNKDRKYAKKKRMRGSTKFLIFLLLVLLAGFIAGQLSR